MAQKTNFNRRGFFKMMGLSATAAATACSRAPVNKIIPFLVQPEEITPGVAVSYASTCGACPASCGLLVKTRDGRPIKIEGNELHPVSRGGVCAIGQASVLTLYDASRARGPMSSGKPTTWRELDTTVRNGLRGIAAANRAIRLVTPPYVGPSGKAAIDRFLTEYPTARRVSHDPLGTTAIAEAHLLTHGVRAIPGYSLDRARVIVAVAADFLGAWHNPVALTRQYVSGRDPDQARTMSRHFQLESHLTVTGANADVRMPFLPSDLVPALAALAKRLGIETAVTQDPVLAPAFLDRLAAELREARGASLLLCGSDDVAAQALTNAINQTLDNYGVTVALPSGVFLPESQTIEDLLVELRKGEVGALIVLGTNPVYTHPDGSELGERLSGVELTIATADRLDETGSRTQHLAPDHNYLESWGDAEPERGLLGLFQPAVAPLYDTRSAFESILVWAGAGRSYYDFVRNHWESTVFPAAVDPPSTFDAFWEQSVHDGFARVTPGPIELSVREGSPAPSTRRPASRTSKPIELSFQKDGLLRALATWSPVVSADGFELVLYPPVALRDGSLGNNAWLQELPDPITKVTWGNVVSIAPSAAQTIGVSDGDLVNLRQGDRRLTLPVLLQPGMHPRVVAVDLGRGRTHAGPVGNLVGENGFLLARSAGRPRLTHVGVRIESTGQRVTLARTQLHDSMEGRGMVQEMNFDQLLGGSKLTGGPNAEEATHPSMWSRYEYPGHRWAMAIDLSKCTGCSACLVACQAENNVAIVGVDEVRRGREMSWIQIDRYYDGPPEAPRVLNQPMLCQHCENAPCETVCPVGAVTHSSEGLAQMVYNRCVGTRYCANNCPFKIRRFNWFDYPRDPTERMVLNPDVTVRSRGVTEKCSFCVQRIQAAKAQARRENRPLKDGDARPACEQSCPAGAIVFGDVNDPTSRVAEFVRSGRAYRLLPQLNVGPSVSYLARVRNPGKEA